MIFRARSAKRNPRRLSVRRRLTLEREIGTESAPPSQVRHWVAQDSEKPAARRFSGRAAARPIAEFTAARAVLLSRPVPVQGGGGVFMYFLPDFASLVSRYRDDRRRPLDTGIGYRE